MTDAGYDDAQRPAGGPFGWTGPERARGGVPGGGAPQGPAGPMGDWLQEGALAWPAGPPPYPAAAPWVAPPDQDDRVSRWSWGAAAPWVVAGLLCAVLLTSRAAPPAPEPVAVPSPAAPAELAAVPAPAPQPGCAEVAQ